MRKLLNWVNCHFLGLHEWTSASMQGVKPTTLSMAAFKEHSRLYCEHCGINSKYRL